MGILNRFEQWLYEVNEGLKEIIKEEEAKNAPKEDPNDPSIYYNEKIANLKAKYNALSEDNTATTTDRMLILEEIKQLEQLKDKEVAEYNRKLFAKANLKNKI